MPMGYPCNNLTWILSDLKAKHLVLKQAYKEQAKLVEVTNDLA